MLLSISKGTIISLTTWPAERVAPLVETIAEDAINRPRTVQRSETKLICGPRHSVKVRNKSGVHAFSLFTVSPTVKTSPHPRVPFSTPEMALITFPDFKRILRNTGGYN